MKKPAPCSTSVVPCPTFGGFWASFIDEVRAEFPAVRLIVNAANRGYPGGNNDGIVAAQGRYVLILNPDTQDSWAESFAAFSSMLISDTMLLPTVVAWPMSASDCRLGNKP